MRKIYLTKLLDEADAWKHPNSCFAHVLPLVTILQLTLVKNEVNPTPVAEENVMAATSEIRRISYKADMVS